MGVPVLTMGSKLVLVHIKCFVFEYSCLSRPPPLRTFVYWNSTYRLCVLKMSSNHDSRQVMKFVHFRSAYSLSVLGMRSKHD